METRTCTFVGSLGTGVQSLEVEGTQVQPSVDGALAGQALGSLHWARQRLHMHRCAVYQARLSKFNVLSYAKARSHPHQSMAPEHMEICLPICAVPHYSGQSFAAAKNACFMQIDT